MPRFTFHRTRREDQCATEPGRKDVHRGSPQRHVRAIESMVAYPPNLRPADEIEEQLYA